MFLSMLLLLSLLFAMEVVMVMSGRERIAEQALESLNPVGPSVWHTFYIRILHRNGIMITTIRFSACFDAWI